MKLTCEQVFLLQIFINNLLYYMLSKISSNFSDACLCLLFLRIWIPASRLARIFTILLAFLDFLQSHTCCKTEEKMNMIGSLRSFSMLKLKRRICSDWRLGEAACMALRRKVAAELLLGHSIRACWRLSRVFMVQRSHNGLVVLGMCIRNSLSLVGRILWNISQRKVVSSDGRPGVTDRCQIVSQFLSEKVSSALEGISTWEPCSSSLWVTLFSNNTLYHVLLDMVVTFNRPSSLTALIFWKKCSS